MSQIDLESFHRLEEFPSFISCIRSFGRSIIPPLVTPDHIHELREFRVSAVKKEAEILRRKQDHLREMKDNHTLSMLLQNDQQSDLQSSVQDSCALWYPSYFSNREVSVAISKFPTSGIYSSVHTDAIVCSDVVGSNHGYNSNVTKDDLIDPGANIADCIECSHSNMNLECSLCLAELNQNFCNKSFPGDVSPEVPCMLLQHGDTSVMGGEINVAVQEAECESLPTVISNQKNLQPDTEDSESNATCMTQSTDLEKYMELSCEFSSPDNSAVIWDSKTTSLQCTLSRSDDASSETIVNTENELTPCASTMAELTDNIEDELSNAEEVTGATDSKEVPTGEMKRAHSVDSYMKILQNCGILSVKKSQSEPFNTKKASADINDVKTVVTSKTNLLIKEDSKESEEARDMPEKDDCSHENIEVSTRDEETLEPEPNKSNSFKKKHVRQNSYTLDEPSSALILAHADCACNFDAKCASPHCSALKDTSEVIPNSAFVKEKVDISASPPHMKMLPILNSERTPKEAHLNKVETSSTVVDVFPNVKEESCEKSDSGNTKTTTNTCVKEDSNLDVAGSVGKSFLEKMNLSNQPKHLEFIQHICEELRAKHELKVKELHEKQNKQWLELEEEFKQQEALLFQKIIALESSRDDSMKSDFKCNNDGTVSGEKSTLQDDVPASNSFGSLSDKFPTSDSSSSTQASILSISNNCSSSSLSPPEVSVLPGNARALSPSKDCMSPDKNPSMPAEIIKTNQLSKHSSVSVSCVKQNKDPTYIASESVSEVNGYSHPASFVPRYSSLPEYRSAIAVPICNECDKVGTCFCDNTVQPCRCCTSINGCSEYAVDNPPPYSLYPAREQDSIPFNKSASSQSDSNAFKKQSPCLAIKNGSHSANFSHSRKNVANLSKISNDYVSITQNDALSSLENGELSNVQQHDKEQRKKLSQSINEKSPIDNLESAETSKNESCKLYHETLNKKMSIDPLLRKKFEKLPAFVKGYLTRCLLNTVYVQGLIKTFKDTAVLISKQREDSIAKGDPISQTDIDFQRQLIILLMTTYDTFYDTFFTISTKDQMAIISECRKSKLKQEPTLAVATASPETSVCKPYLSSATLKVLQRKKRSSVTIDNRTYNVEDLRKSRSRSELDMSTYTIDDLPSFRGRAQSSMSSKNTALSPSSIYKNSIGIKRKTASAKSSGSKAIGQQKWVP